MDVADDKIWKFEKLILRQYQIELIQKAKSKNSIIFLPCGAGKTFISIGVLRSRSADLAKCNKRVAIFLANTQFLVLQLSEAIDNFTNYGVKTLYGEMGVDLWTDEDWRRELADKQVICSTPAVFLTIIQKNIMNLHDISLLVLDECHHAVLNHPYNEIMKEFQVFGENDGPLVLGLTGCVLNSNPKKGLSHHISTLKTNLKSSFAFTDTMNEIFKFWEEPVEYLVAYDPTEKTPDHELLLDILKKSAEYSNIFQFSDPDHILANAGLPSDTTLLNKWDSFKREIMNMYSLLERIIEQLGLLAMFHAALYFLIRMERRKILRRDTLSSKALTYITSVLNKIRRIIYKLMMTDGQRDIKKYCSNKVKALIEFVEGLKNNYSDGISCIIFVREKVTALTLAYIFNSITHSDKFFKSEFVTGSFFNLMAEPEEFSQYQFSSKKVIKRFHNKEFNFLFATDVLLEGIDLPACSLIINFDEPKTYTAYIQSKGRARSKKSQYVILMEREKSSDMQEKLNLYKQIHVKLLQEVCSDSSGYFDDAESSSSDYLVLEKSTNLRISPSTAVSLIYRFCSCLPQDSHSLLSPVCSYDAKEKTAYLSLPYSSGIRKVIKGNAKPNRSLAKKDVFMKAVKELHERGFISKTLHFRMFPSEEETFNVSFPNLKPLPNIYDAESDGWIRNKLYEIHCGESLCRCLPCPGETCYLHVIKVTPQFSRPDSRQGVIYDFFRDSNNFAILSGKRMRKICDFPLYLRMGELECKLIVNAESLTLDSEELLKIRKFHFFIFNFLLKVVKRLQTFDARNEEFSFFVVPVTDLGNSNFRINWDIINYEVDLSEISSLNSLVCENPKISDYLLSVIYPKYRGTMAKYYVVTSLDHDQTPLSEFPSRDFRDYYTYFREKYQVDIKDKMQPLIEVKALPEKINFLKPRSSEGYKRKKKYQEENANFQEYLVPELCCKMSFPASIWLKALMLPSALYRITTISCIDDYREAITRDMELDACKDDDDDEWLPLEAEVTANNEEDLNSIGQFDPCTMKTQRNPIFMSQHSESEMPSIDPFRNMLEIAPCDLKHYLKSISSVSETAEDKFGNKFESKTEHAVPDLALKNDNNKKSELRDYVKAFTCKSANDVFDLERYEFFGDSFLKFAAAVYLFKNFDHNVGFLASSKDKLVSNEHLCGCSRARGLHKALIVNEFEPKSVWNAPLFSFPDEIEKSVADIVVLDYAFEIPAKEKLAGKLSPQTLRAIQDLCQGNRTRESMYEQSEVVSKGSNLLKKLADSVEALIGLHVLDGGLIGGFRFLNWLELLPEDTGSYDYLLKTHYEAIVDSEMDIFDHMSEVSFNDLENVLGYKFKNKALLLEAITHPSYQCGRWPCYERLEFLGDALLDFILTIYIYDNMKDAGAGSMTDMRSSLVNNIIMACLSVKHGFHKYMLHDSSSLLQATKEFSVFQKKRNHRIDNDIMIMSEEGDDKSAESMEVPKALADIFESIAAAIFLDSGSLETVWKIYYKFMACILDDFLSDPPKSPVRLLYEMCKPEFTSKINDNGIIETVCKIVHNDKEESFSSKGKSKEKTKYCAAKLALRFLYNSNDVHSI